MSRVNRLIESLRRVTSRASDADLDDELRFHVDMEAAALERRGLSVHAAREEARRRFGGVDRYGEEVRDVRGGRWMEWLVRDTRHALRLVRRFPGFSAIVIGTLGGAIGANAAIFSIIDAALLRSLPFPEPQQLVALYAQNPDKSLPRFSVSYADYLDWKRETRSFTDMAALASTTMTLSGEGRGEPERLAGLSVTNNFFAVLGATPALGRLFGPEDATGESSDAVILTEPFWRRRFGGDSSIIGKSVQFAARSRVVIGVLPDTFRLDGRPIDAVTVLAASALPGAENHGQHLLESIARLKPGVTIAGAQQDLAAVAARVAQAHPDIRGWSANAFSYRDELTRGVKQPLLVLLAAAGLVLLIGCTNVASLLITRGAARGREVALRQALGASRARLVSQLLIESAVLALGGGIVGIAVAVAGTRVMIKLAPPGLIPGAERVGMDVRVLAFALGLSLLTAALVGVWPAVRASSARLIETLHDGGRTSAGTMHAARFRRLLVVAETALALVLLVCSALVLQSLSNILGVDPGFQVDRVVAMRVTLSPAAYPDSTFVAFYRELTTRLVGRAGIEAAAAANTPPLASGGVVPQIRPLGRPNVGAEPMMSATTAITPGYFRTAGIRLIAGRDIAWSDPQPVLVLSQSAARRLWPGENVLGKRIAFGQRDTVGLEIVGVVSDSRARGLTADPVPMIYMSFGGALNVVRTMSLLVRGAGDPASIMTASRAVVHELDPKLPLYNVQTLREIVDRSIAQPRLNTTLLTLFAAMALLLATVGIYGVVSYTVALRSRELGLRMALGAQRRDVLRLVLREGAVLALGGVVIGVVASFGATRVIRSWLFGIGPGDVSTLVAMSLALVAVALMASYVPARRATQVDPTLAMRAE